jgi:dihydroorotase
MGTLIKNGQIVDLNTNETLVRDILVEDGVISTIGSGLSSIGHQVVDATGKLVSAGLVDIHTHLREPGFEQKETIATGTRSAARGGYTTICCMPNTRPVIDSPRVIQFIRNKTDEEGSIKVIPYATITKNQLGQEMTDFAALKEAGAFAFTDDGVGVQSSQMMKNAMIRAKELGMPIVAHCEDDTMVKGGSVHDGEFARKHGLKGIPSESEAIHVGRDILLAEATGVHYHVCHISAEQSVRLVRQGKAMGVNVTTEVTPHHLLLTEDDIPGPDANWKMNPPLRSKTDKAALIQGLKDGTIDIIATDHAPHTPEEKTKGMQLAPFGIVGFETAFPLLYTHFVLTGELTLAQLLDKMTRKPAQLFNLSAGELKEGLAADLTLIDLEKELEITPQTFLSKGKNTPFAGWKCKGWPVLTMVDGNIIWSSGDVEVWV